MKQIDGVEFTKSGQPRPYADHEYVGTVKAQDEREAKEKLKSYFSGVIHQNWSREKWWEPFFKEFSQHSAGVWKFHVCKQYTG